MRKPGIIIIAGAALALCACQTAPNVPSAPIPVPAVLAPTKVDETALRAAWGSFDVALDAINLWKAAKPAVKGTPKARLIADAIDAVNAALTAAQINADALNAGRIADPAGYLKAMADAKIALVNLRAALRSN